MLFEYWFYGILFVAVCAAFWLLRRAHKYPYHAKGYLLTEAERAFLPSLRACLPDTMDVMMKVRLADIIDCNQAHWRAGWGRYIAAKHIDFVVIDALTTEMTLCVELDDSSHNAPDRQDRDVFVNKALKAAGVPLLRVSAARRYDLRWLKAQIELAEHKGYAEEKF